ncbi:MAG: hypothetical protein ACOX7I_06495 [Oscillospiraceae bacterium]|jgi:hypothetical protein
MSKVKTVKGPWLVEENISLKQLVIHPGAEITAPPGKKLTMTIGGVPMDMRPGRYTGDILITVSEEIPIEFYMGEPVKLRAAVCLENRSYVPHKSVPAAVRSGSVGGEVAKDISIVSKAEGLTGIYVGGDGEYVIENARIDLEGDGGNDFVGYGAGVGAYGNVKLTVNNSEITVRGVARNAVFSGGYSEITLNNVTVRAYEGVLPHDYQDTIIPGQMKCVPWMLGLRGNCRATNLADYSTARWNNCKLYSEGWGVMSTDAVDVCRMYVKDSHIEITDNSGYGAFSIGDCHDYFDNCTFKVPDYALIMANDNACGTFDNGCVIESGRFGVMCFNNTGKLFINNSTFNTQKTTVLVKGCAPQINMDGAKLNPGNGKILQFFNSDDPGNPQGYYIDPVEEDKPDPSHDTASCREGIDVIAKFSNMEIAGDFYNGYTVVKGDTGPPMEMPPMPPMGGEPPGDPPAPPYEGARNLCLSFLNTKVEGIISASKSRHRVEKVSQDNCEELGEITDTPCEAINNGVNVSMDASSKWTVTGTSYITCLELAEGAQVTAPKGKSLKMTVDGVETPIKAGSYKGKITLLVE